MRWCPRILFGCVFLTLAAGTSDRAMAQSAAVHVGQRVRALVEADWIARDRTFSPGKSFGGGDFSLAHTRDVLRRGRQLVERFRPATDGDRLLPLAAELTLYGVRL